MNKDVGPSTKRGANQMASLEARLAMLDQQIAVTTQSYETLGHPTRRTHRLG